MEFGQHIVSKAGHARAIHQDDIEERLLARLIMTALICTTSLVSCSDALEPTLEPFRHGAQVPASAKCNVTLQAVVFLMRTSLKVIIDHFLTEIDQNCIVSCWMVFPPVK